MRYRNRERLASHRAFVLTVGLALAASCTIKTFDPTPPDDELPSGGSGLGGTEASTAGARSTQSGGNGTDPSPNPDGGSPGGGDARTSQGGDPGVIFGDGPAGEVEGFVGDAGYGAGGAPDLGTSSCRPADGGPGIWLSATIRDFRADHIDFEPDANGSEPGLVKDQLGPDRKPVYSGIASMSILGGAASFNQWYRNVPGVNIPFYVTLTTSQDGQEDSFNRSEYFPIDGRGFGNEGNPHNYHFTTEIHTVFEYHGGENFSFTGDDDVWVFVNNTLVIDLGGIHGPESETLSVDDVAKKLGMTPGKSYPMDFFHAERHTTESHFRIDTNLSFIMCSF